MRRHYKSMYKCVVPYLILALALAYDRFSSSGYLLESRCDETPLSPAFNLSRAVMTPLSSAFESSQRAPRIALCSYYPSNDLGGLTTHELSSALEGFAAFEKRRMRRKGRGRTTPPTSPWTSLGGVRPPPSGSSLSPPFDSSAPAACSLSPCPVSDRVRSRAKCHCRHVRPRTLRPPKMSPPPKARPKMRSPRIRRGKIRRIYKRRLLKMRPQRRCGSIGACLYESSSSRQRR